MKKATVSADGVLRMDVAINHRIGVDEIAGALEYVCFHSYIYTDLVPENIRAPGNESRVVLWLSKNLTKAKIMEVVKDVLRDEGTSFEMKNWDNNGDLSVLEQVQDVIADRFIREFPHTKR